MNEPLTCKKIKSKIKKMQAEHVDMMKDLISAHLHTNQSRSVQKLCARFLDTTSPAYRGLVDGIVRAGCLSYTDQ